MRKVWAFLFRAVGGLISTTLLASVAMAESCPSSDHRDPNPKCTELAQALEIARLSQAEPFLEAAHLVLHRSSRKEAQVLAKDRGLTEVEAALIRGYSYMSSSLINTVARVDRGWETSNSSAVQSFVREGSRRPAFEATIAMMIDGLAKLPDYRGRAVRMAHWAPQMSEPFERRYVRFPGFVSSSRGEKPAWNVIGGSPIRMDIESRHGKDISAFSANPIEREILFVPDTCFRVIEIKRNRQKIPERIRLEEVESSKCDDLEKR